MPIRFFIADGKFVLFMIVEVHIFTRSKNGFEHSNKSGSILHYNIL